MRRAVLGLALLLAALPVGGCAGSPLRPEASAEVRLWRTDFAIDRDALLAAIDGWQACGLDLDACWQALARVEVRSAILSRIDSPSHPNVVDDHLLPPPRCLGTADQLAMEATMTISRGARAGWDAYENGNLSEIGVAQTEVYRGRGQLAAATRLVDAAAC